MKKLLASVLLFIFAWGFIAMAQVASPIASPSPISAVISAPPAQSSIMAWITAHGGFQGAVLLLVGSALAILSGVRQVLYNFDGVAPGTPIPVGMVGLTWVNKFCVIAGKIVDYLTGNVAH